MLVDTPYLYFRAFFGVPGSIRAPDGRPVNAIRGLLDSLASLVGAHSPEQLVCCWDDNWRPAWRVELVPSYKAHRVADGGTEEMPDDLAPQVPLIRQILEAIGIPVVGVPDMEADDIIATLAARAPGPVLVVTGDRDLFQLVDDEQQVSVLYIARGLAKQELVDEAWLLARYGITGAQYADFAVLRGDPSDGLPGVRGIGEKTAASLISRYGDLPGLLAHLDDLSPAVRRSLAAASDYLTRAVPVVRTVRNLDLPHTEAPLPVAPVEPVLLNELTSELGLGGSVGRLLSALSHTAGDST
jgi:5'-3' exonuclease